MSEPWISKDGQIVCSNCGVSRKTGAPDHGRSWIYSGGNYIGLSGFERHQLGFDELYDSCICRTYENYQRSRVLMPQILLEIKKDRNKSEQITHAENRFKRLNVIFIASITFLILILFIVSVLKVINL